MSGGYLYLRRMRFTIRRRLARTLSRLGEGQVRVGTQAHGLLLAAAAVVPAPQLRTGGRHIQVQSPASSQLAGAPVRVGFRVPYGEVRQRLGQLGHGSVLEFCWYRF